MGCSFYDDLAVYQDYTGIIVTPEQASGIVEALGDKRADPRQPRSAHRGADGRTGADRHARPGRSCAMALRALATGQPLQQIGPDAATLSKAILTQPDRYPFQWDAMIRHLDRAGVKYGLAE
ncbi:MAG: hypothetical protein R3C10_03030 [Pirellulales bacterium]